MSGLYPAIEPFASATLKSGLHEIYYEQSGNPQGAPVLFLHGGPGAGSSPKHRQFFDPAHYRIIIIDQRGCGKSKPHAEIRDNSTDFLISDIEAIRGELGLKRWHVFGGSWGSTLALSYAIAHPERVASLALRGIFLMTKREIDWFLYGARAVFPDKWDEFTKLLSPEEKKDILGSYYRMLTHQNPAVHIPAAQSWAAYETAICKLIPSGPMVEESKEPSHALPISRIEAHYFMHDRLKDGRFILDHVDKFRRIPAVIVQGRYDAVCPIETAWELHKAWPEADLRVIPDAGHSAFEEGIARELVRVTDEFRQIKP